MSHPDVRRHLLAVSLSLALFAPYAQSCGGGGMPNRLLNERAAFLAELPDTSFANEVLQMAKDVPGLNPATHQQSDYRWNGQDRETAESTGLTVEQSQMIRTLRGLSTAAAAEQDGTSLPAELRLYTAGAVAFSHGDDSLAANYFNRVLALPADERELRGTWAAYSLGRSLAREASSLPEDQRQTKVAASRQAFERTRQWVMEGAHDPLALAPASLGEDARLELQSGNWAAAISLYASQYKLGMYSGYDSLMVVARDLLLLPDEQLLPLLQQLPVQQLLTAYLLGNPDPLSAIAAQRKKLSALLHSGSVEQLVSADRLAALSYQNGEYDEAASFLAHAPDSGLTWWLRAKSALRAADLSTAEIAFAKAAAAFPAQEQWHEGEDGEPLKPRCRVAAEGAVLALHRGDYRDALDALYRSNLYWSSTADVAERVLTVNELKDYVDRHVPSIRDQLAASEPDEVRLPATRLRALLARRLMRAGRYEEAANYFQTDELMDVAHRYGAAKHAAQSRWTDTGRAEALYQLGKLTRDYGMELFGFEMYSYTPYREWDPSSGTRAPALKATPLLSADEIERRNTHAIPQSRRYELYKNAAELANQAADLLPNTSQAYAATLCQAAGWTLFTHQDLAKGYYQRYVENGPAVPWADRFGRNCQEPNFQRVDSDRWQAQFDQTRRTLRPYKSGLIGLVLLVAAGVIGFWRKRRVSTGK